MNDTNTRGIRGTKTAPIEAWLTQRNLEIICQVVNENESTESLDVESPRCAVLNEITGWLIDQGYAPVGRWRTEDANGNGDETSRTFKPASVERAKRSEPRELPRVNWDAP